MKTSRRVIGILLAAVLAVALLVAGWLGSYWYRQASQLERLVAVSWGDGRFGKALYGAYVYYDDPEQAGGPLQVRLRVRIDRASVWSRYAHDPRLLGTAKDPAEAVAKWGVLRWSEQGLSVGNETGPAYLFPRAELENHR